MTDCTVAKGYYVEQAATGSAFFVFFLLACHQLYLERFLSKRPSVFMRQYRRLLVASTLAWSLTSIDARSVHGIYPLLASLLLTAMSVLITCVPVLLQSFSLAAGSFAATIQSQPRWLRPVFQAALFPWLVSTVVRAFVQSNSSASPDALRAVEVVLLSNICFLCLFLLTVSVVCWRRLTRTFREIRPELPVVKVPSDARDIARMLRVAQYNAVSSLFGVALYGARAVLVAIGRLDAAKNRNPCVYAPSFTLWLFILPCVVILWFVWIPWSIQRKRAYGWISDKTVGAALSLAMSSQTSPNHRFSSRLYPSTTATASNKDDDVSQQSTLP